jgi:ParB-like chromosome segregation protein Spo0J
MTTGDNGYALDMLSPIRHVATEMDGAAPAALSIEEMTATYQHPNPGDLARVRRHEDCGSDDEATAWLIRRAVEAISYRGKTDQSKPQLEQIDGGYRLVVPFEDLLYDGRKLERTRNDHARLGDPFNPMSGVFSENIRQGKRYSDTQADDELRESMKGGWLPGHPAIVDEHGVVLVGHRRLAIAKELGIAPETVRLPFGDGDAGDIERLRVAVQSNLGVKEFSRGDRAEIARYLAERGWAQASIAEALHVAQQTISDDLRGHDITGPGNVTDSLGRKKSPGRPRKITPEQEPRLIRAYFDEGKSIDEAAREVLGPNASHSLSSVIKVIDQERGRREERAHLQHEQAASDVRADLTPEPLSPVEVPMHACPQCRYMHPVTGS